MSARGRHMPCYRLDGLGWPREISLHAWMHYTVRQAARLGPAWNVLRKDVVGPYEVSSIFIGVGPAPFETMVFHAGGVAFEWHTASWRSWSADDCLALHGGLVMQFRAVVEGEGKGERCDGCG